MALGKHSCRRSVTLTLFRFDLRKIKFGKADQAAVFLRKLSRFILLLIGLTLLQNFPPRVTSALQTNAALTTVKEAIIT